MIQKLRKKIIAVSMLSLFAVLAVLLTTINLINYRNTVAKADEVLELLSANEGLFPGPAGRFPAHLSPEVPFESRYFTVTTNAAGEVLRIDTGRIAAISPDKALSFARHATDRSGFVADYRYLRTQTGDRQMLIFLDCGRQLDSCRQLLTVTVAVALLGYGLVFILVLLLSRRIVRPFSENYEKQRRFITDAGHELKTPLTIIRADTDILEMELEDNEWLRDIRKQTDRLASLTADLVLLSRMEESAKSLVMTDFSLSDRVSETAQSFMAPAQTGNKSLSVSVTPMLTLCGNEPAIDQLISILLDNALKYAPEDTAITLTLEKQGSTALLSVTNRLAAPMEKAQLSSLFDRFYRGDSARSSAGHGIGLSVAQAITAAHSGKIRAELPEENTIRITATLPISR